MNVIFCNKKAQFYAGIDLGTIKNNFCGISFHVGGYTDVFKPELYLLVLIYAFIDGFFQAEYQYH